MSEKLEKLNCQSWVDGQEGNNKGVRIEEKVANILARLPKVVAVRVTTKFSDEDKEMIDLVIDLAKNCGLSIDEVFVQIKSSPRGMEHFKDGLSLRLRRNHQTATSEDRKRWMWQNRIILLNGDVRKSGSGRISPVTDVEIVDSFESQLGEIDCYWKSRVN